jgi:hypothetical protein
LGSAPSFITNYIALSAILSSCMAVSLKRIVFPSRSTVLANSLGLGKLNTKSAMP